MVVHRLAPEELALLTAIEYPVSAYLVTFGVFVIPIIHEDSSILHQRDISG